MALFTGTREQQLALIKSLPTDREVRSGLAISSTAKQSLLDAYARGDYSRFDYLLGKTEQNFSGDLEHTLSKLSTANLNYANSQSDEWKGEVEHQNELLAAYKNLFPSASLPQPEGYVKNSAGNYVLASEVPKSPSNTFQTASIPSVTPISTTIPFKAGLDDAQKTGITNLVLSGRAFSDTDAKNYAFAIGDSNWQQYVGKPGGGVAPSPAPAASPVIPGLNTAGLDEAAIRRQNGTATPTDLNNLAYAESKGWKASAAPTSSPGAPAPSAPPTPGAGGTPGSVTDLPADPSATSTVLDGIDRTGWTDAMNQSFDAMQSYVDTLTKSGKIVNPDIVFDEDTIARFTSQAKTELGPYWNQIFDQTASDIKTGLTRIGEDLNAYTQKLGKQFGQQLEQTQESFARRGLNFSSDRNKAEATLADTFNTALSTEQQTQERAAYDFGTKGERMIGSTLFPNGIPDYTTGAKAQLGTPGQYGFSTGTSRRALFDPLGNTTGSLESDRTFSEESRVVDLKNAKRELDATRYL
jgi:hypothetical protein